MPRKRVLIMGAAGRDFHNFNMVFRNNPDFEVVAFTATQIPNIDDRRYPPELSGDLYPTGIPIHSEADLESLIRDENVDVVVFSYSDVPNSYVMGRGSAVMAAGSDFTLLGPNATYLRSSKPVIAITAVRTGSGKSQTTRRVAEILRQAEKSVAVIRHPMPYGNLAAQAVQEFRSMEDLTAADCTIEEREEYEPHLELGNDVYAGVDYERILRMAEREHDVILWDGGNNDLPFIRPDVHITVVDPLRSGNEIDYYPGQVNLRRADVVVINKIDSATPDEVVAVRETTRRLNPNATVVEAASPFELTYPQGLSSLNGLKVLVVEDGPTLTHGEMPYGAGVVVARKLGALLIDPRPFAVGTIQATFEKYPHIGALLPAMGYGEVQTKELEQTINASQADAVIVATPIDLAGVLHIDAPAVRVRYRLQEIGSPTIEDVLRKAGFISDGADAINTEPWGF